jgi:hypothetical protein
MGCVLVVTGWAAAQEFRGSINGQVTDEPGNAVHGAQVSVTALATNTTTTTTTNESGHYSVLYLEPGTYRITVESKGFKKLMQQGIEVRVGDALTLDLKLEVGAVEEVVNVTSTGPLLEESSGSLGQVIDQRRIEDLPLSDGNPFTLSRLAPGIAYNGDLKFSRPFDNAGTSSIITDGASGGNEFTLDGSPDQANGRRVAFVPPSDAVQQFKVQTASFDAQQGHTGGSVINNATRSGTNSLHGTAYDFVRNDVLSANDFFLNRAGQPRSALRYNRYGGSIGGPVWIPKLYNGRDKTFIFFAFEGLKDKFPEPLQFTVPTAAERNGDFSALLSQQILIYDPATAKKLSNGRVQRTPFLNNVIKPDRISPIAQAYLKFYPLPDQAGDAQGRNNYISNNPRSDAFDSETARIDHSFSENQRAFFRFARNWRRELRNNWTGTVNGLLPTGNYLFRVNDGATYDHIYTVNATTFLDFRVGYGRFLEQNQKPSFGVFNPADLGFSQQTVAFFGGFRYLPRFNMSNFSNIGDNAGDLTTFNIYSIQPSLTKVIGGHSLRAGYDFRAYRENGLGPGNAAAQYDFSTNFTRGPLDNSSGAIGQDLAALLLGQPTGGSIDRNTGRSNQTLYNGLFIQDDWKVTRNLSLNLGLRYEREGGTTERFDRNVRGFDMTSANPIAAAAIAAYAAHPIPEIAPANFQVNGGLLFAGPGHSGFWNADGNNFQPRIGVAYRVDDKTVVRGGLGVFTVPFITDGVFQTGFSQATQIVPSLDTGVTFRANLLNPFPDGVATPPGSSLGLATSIGRNVEFVPLSRRNGQNMRWQVSIQREFPGRWLVEAAYVGNHAYDLTTTVSINPIPAQYLSTKATRDQPVIDFLTANVTNPFQGLAAGTGLNGSSVQRQQLLRPFPEFTDVITRRNDGSSTYNSAQLRIEKRLNRGFTLNVSYTWSKLLEQISLLNATDAKYEKRVSDVDLPQRVVFSGLWELPFGRGRFLGKNWNRVEDGALGGWQFGAIYQAQSGFPLTLGNVYFGGDLNSLRTDIAGPNVDHTFPISGFYFSDAAVQTNGIVDPAKQRADTRIRLANNIRTLASRFPWFRGQGLNLWDCVLSKNFPVRERARLLLRADFLNATNHPVFAGSNLDPTSADFGKTTVQNNLPRQVQIALKLIF